MSRTFTITGRRGQSRYGIAYDTISILDMVSDAFATISTCNIFFLLTNVQRCETIKDVCLGRSIGESKTEFQKRSREG